MTTDDPSGILEDVPGNNSAPTPPNGFLYWCTRGHWTRSAHDNLEDEGCWAMVCGARCVGRYGEPLVPWDDVLAMLGVAR